jgi:hypothetical protein
LAKPATVTMLVRIFLRQSKVDIAVVEPLMRTVPFGNRIDHKAITMNGIKGPLAPGPLGDPCQSINAHRIENASIVLNIRFIRHGNPPEV